jgi:predicted regulator of Ras-like GTPase activity (Roadblock/LC7/MglB family)
VSPCPDPSPSFASTELDHLLDRVPQVHNVLLLDRHGNLLHHNSAMPREHSLGLAEEIAPVLAVAQQLSSSLSDDGRFTFHLYLEDGSVLLAPCPDGTVLVLITPLDSAAAEPTPTRVVTDAQAALIAHRASPAASPR